MNGLGGETINVCDMNLDRAVPDKLEEVGWIVEDTQGTRSPEGAGPGLQFLHLRMFVVSVQIFNVMGKDTPEAVDDFPAHDGTVQESSDGRKAIPVSPDARAEPGQEPRGDQFLEPYLERRHVCRRHPHRSMAGIPDDPIDRDAMGGEGVSGIPRRLGPAEDCNIGRTPEQGIGVIQEISTVEQRRVKRCASRNVRHKWLRRQSSSNYEFTREKL